MLHKTFIFGIFKVLYLVKKFKPKSFRIIERIYPTLNNEIAFQIWYREGGGSINSDTVLNSYYSLKKEVKI